MTTPGDGTSPRVRIALLAAQAFALGLTLAWMTIPASAIFLSTYGSDLLPVTYIGAACAGAATSASLAVQLRRRPLPGVATLVIASLTGLLLAAWGLLGRSGSEWMSFVLLVVVPIVVPVGFIFVVGQAGLLLDVRTLKALYARVVAGFALGVMCGGLAGPPLLAALGQTEDLLVASVLASGALLALVLVTRQLHPEELSAVDHEASAGERPTLRGIGRDPYVRLIVTFQVLSAIESQWLDFLVFDRAAQRYDDSEQLARFVSRFSAIAYGVDIIFLLLLAGILLRRFGLRYGLSANALGVLAVLAAIIATTVVVGSATTIVFVLVVAARVADLTFSDGTSRTSLSAAYQAVPTRIRAMSQAAVEGLAVPVAIGFAGVALLVVDAAGRTRGLLLPILTAGVVVAWVRVAFRLYREYGVNLLASLRGRTLDAGALMVDDESSLVVVDRLVESDDARDVRLGLDILTLAQHPALHARLEQLTADRRSSVRTDAITRLRDVAPHLAANAARAGLDDPSEEVRAACVRVLGAERGPRDLDRLVALGRDPSAEVQVAVVYALTRSDSPDRQARVEAEVLGLARSPDIEDRVLAARMLGECDAATGVDRAVLTDLLDDADDRVVRAAMAGLRWPDDAAWLPDVARHVHDRATAEAAAEALVRCGAPALHLVDDALSAAAPDRRIVDLYVRVARDVGGAASVAVLRAHLDHADAEVGLAVLRALATLTQPEARRGVTPAVAELEVLGMIGQDLEHAARVLRALVVLEPRDGEELLERALRDDLEVRRRRILAALSLRHGTAAIDRVALHLAQPDARSHALALEWLEVIVASSERGAIALLEPGIPDRERLVRLARHAPHVDLDPQAVLLDLVADERRWRPWIRACALYATSSSHPDVLHAVAQAVLASPPPVDAESAALHETAVGLRARHLDPV